MEWNKILGFIVAWVVGLHIRGWFMSNGMDINGMIVGRIGRNRDAEASFFVYELVNSG